MPRIFSLNDFHAKNALRGRTTFAPKHSKIALIACMSEELGETAAAVLRVTGEKKRRASEYSNDDILDGVADLITYALLLAHECGCDDPEALLANVFNMVSDRSGSNIKVGLDG